MSDRFANPHPPLHWNRDREGAGRASSDPAGSANPTHSILNPQSSIHPERDIAVEARGLTKRFGRDFVAVDRIDFTVDAGTIYGFLGPNGAGKTTTIKMLCGILAPTGGAGHVGGFDIVREQPRIKEIVGYMSQRFGLYGDLTVAQNLDFYAGIYRVESDTRRARIREVLELSGLAGREKRLTGELSGGFKQRLALGCAILHEPRILFLDEPTAGVDPISRRRFWDLIHEMKSRGVTVFVTTHYMDEAEHCDALSLIAGGRIIASGAPRKLREEAIAGKLFAVHAGDLGAAMNALAASAPHGGHGSVQVFGRELHVEADSADDIRARLDGANIGGADVREIRPTLEDAFIALVERGTNGGERSRDDQRRDDQSRDRQGAGASEAGGTPALPAAGTGTGTGTGTDHDTTHASRNLQSSIFNLRSRILPIALKETRHIVRDWRTLTMAIGAPIVMLLLFGYAITFDIRYIRLAVFDGDLSPESRDLIDRFTSSDYFRLAAVVDSDAGLGEPIEAGTAQVAVSIPRGFGDSIRRGDAAKLAVILDGSESNTGTIAAGYVEGILQSFNLDAARAALARAGVTQAPPMPPVEVDMRFWYNPEMESENFIVPGLIAVVMMVMTALLTSLTVVRERERGSLEQLIATPVRTHEVIIGKLLPYFAIGMIDSIIIAVLGVAVFDVPFDGSITLFLAAASVFAVAGLGIGLFISTAAKNQILAMQVAILATMLPAYLLSGFMFAIKNMPAWVQAITYVVPARYFIVMLRGIMLKDLPAHALWPQFAFLAALAVLMLTASIRRFRKKVE
ncbi:ABC transporter permease [bacterium]|nr:ABC transporter permease [bacterium]